MPNTPVPVTRGEVADLARQVGSLQGEVHDLVGTISEGLAERPTAEDLKASRKRFIVWSLVVLLVASAIQVGTFATITSKCFLSPPKGFLYSVCAVIPGYDRIQKENKKNLDQFHHLLGQIPENEQTNREQQREIDHLKRVLRAHGIKP